MRDYAAFPPAELMHRVGKIDEADVAAGYEAVGLESRRRLERLLPNDWSWTGKRVLDFGCGAGRTLRHFLAEAAGADFYGCDIDRPSIAWATEHLSPPLHFFENDDAPPLPQPDRFFDVVYAFSVFTHLTDEWSRWLLELHRILKPDGYLIATVLNRDLWGTYGEGDWVDDRIGMTVTKKWKPWDPGGPIVFHSEWWIRAHWGRAFELVSFEAADPAARRPTQGAVVLRPKEDPPCAEELESPVDDPRELAAARFNLDLLHLEAATLFAELAPAAESHRALSERLEAVHQQAIAANREAEHLRAELARVASGEARALAELERIARSKSWRITAPLRVLAAVRKRR